MSRLGCILFLVAVLAFLPANAHAGFCQWALLRALDALGARPNRIWAIAQLNENQLRETAPPTPYFTPKKTLPGVDGVEIHVSDWVSLPSPDGTILGQVTRIASDSREHYVTLALRFPKKTLNVRGDDAAKLRLTVTPPEVPVRYSALNSAPPLVEFFGALGESNSVYRYKNSRRKLPRQGRLIARYSGPDHTERWLVQEVTREGSQAIRFLTSEETTSATLVPYSEGVLRLLPGGCYWSHSGKLFCPGAFASVFLHSYTNGDPFPVGHGAAGRFLGFDNDDFDRIRFESLDRRAQTKTFVVTLDRAYSIEPASLEEVSESKVYIRALHAGVALPIRGDERAVEFEKDPLSEGYRFKIAVQGKDTRNLVGFRLDTHSVLATSLGIEVDFNFDGQGPFVWLYDVLGANTRLKKLKHWNGLTLADIPGKATHRDTVRMMAKRQAVMARSGDYFMHDWVHLLGYARMPRSIVDALERRAVLLDAWADSEAWKPLAKEIDEEITTLSVMIDDLATWAGDHKKPSELPSNFRILFCESPLQLGQNLLNAGNMTAEERAVLVGLVEKLPSNPSELASDYLDEIQRISSQLDKNALPIVSSQITPAFAECMRK